MTLEELKKYREKCVEVQNTIKRDCVYLQNDITESEHKITMRFEDFVGKVQGLFALLPTEEELRYVEKYIRYDGIIATIDGTGVLVCFGNSHTDIRCPYMSFNIMFGGKLGREGLYITTSKYQWFRITVSSEEFARELICRNTDRLYELFMDLVAELNKAYNNALIEKNKELLDKAEKLRD